MKKNSGFIEIIVLIIIFVGVAYYLGKDPIVLWEKAKPVFAFALDLFVSVIDFIIKSIAAVWGSTQK